jgi:hypothetical protein
MSHPSPAGMGTSAAFLPTDATISFPLGIDTDRLQDAISARRTRAALLEAEWAAACERAAARGAGPDVRIEDRSTWDRSTWNRYLAAAADTQNDYLPQLHRLYEDIARLERLLVPTACQIREGGMSTNEEWDLPDDYYVGHKPDGDFVLYGDELITQRFLSNTPKTTIETWCTTYEAGRKLGYEAGLHARRTNLAFELCRLRGLS